MFAGWGGGEGGGRASSKFLIFRKFGLLAKLKGPKKSVCEIGVTIFLFRKRLFSFNSLYNNNSNNKLQKRVAFNVSRKKYFVVFQQCFRRNSGERGARETGGTAI